MACINDCSIGRAVFLLIAVILPVAVESQCAAKGENCLESKCCVAAGATCFTKNKKRAQCMAKCEKGAYWDPPTDLDPWECDPLKAAPTPAPPTPPPLKDPIPGGHWRQGLKGSHFWDCNGAGCDAATLQPWDEKKFVAAAQYAPADPDDYGGSVYGEQLWMTGAASDLLGADLGPDKDCCGEDKDGGGGCGQCLLISNPSATNSDWMAVVMKKNRCPPDSHGCKDQKHFDLAVPGYDNIKYSTANVCGKDSREETDLTKAQSGVCATWYHKEGVTDTTDGCSCIDLPDKTDNQKMLKRGCELFTAWGWTTGTPDFMYQPVKCPDEFVKRVGGAFDFSGTLKVINPTPPPEECKLTKLREKPGDCAGGDVVGTAQHEATVEGCQSHCNNVRGCNYFIYHEGVSGKNCWPKRECDKNTGGSGIAYTVKACKELRAKIVRERIKKEEEANELETIDTGVSDSSSMPQAPPRQKIVKEDPSSLPPRGMGIKMLILTSLLLGPTSIIIVVALVTRMIAKLCTGQGYNHQAYDATNVS